MRLVKVLLCFLFSFGIAHGSGIVDSLGFISPVDHQIRLTGNFMELRTNHFHAGIDIKSTNGQPGDRIKSVHNGHVSRIKVQSGGYGNALYIDHDNGYTSVYAHLHNYSPQIEKFVEDIQYAAQSFEVDIYLPDSLFRIAQGQNIGAMGNTGRSFGPHLHFELRKTVQEMPINPESLGIGPTDKIAPTLQSLHLHTISKGGELLDKQIRYFKNKGPEYELHDNLIRLDGSHAGLAMQMYDRMDGSWNKNGIYGYQVKVDGKVFFSWKADGFTFDETRYINAFWDYEKQKNHGQKVYLMYRQSCNPFSHYGGHSDGIIDLSDGVARKIDITITDLHKNHSKVSFNLVGQGISNSEVSESLLSCDTTIQRQAGKYTVSFHENAFYAPIDIQVRESSMSVTGKKLASVEIGKPTISVNGYYKISCPAPSGDPYQWTMVTKDSRGRLVHFGGDTLDSRFIAKVDQLGTFALYKDIQAPKVEVINLAATRSKPWKLKVKDNLIDDGRTRDIGYSASVDGKWIRMKYDQKNDLLVFSDFNRLKSGSVNFKLEVWDHCGNKTVFSKRI